MSKAEKPKTDVETKESTYTKDEVINAHKAFGVPKYVVKTVVSLMKKDRLTEKEVKEAIVAFMNKKTKEAKKCSNSV